MSFKNMNYEKIKLLGEAAKYDICSACTKEGRKRTSIDRWIYPSPLPDGRTVNLLKILLTNTCSNDCLYCANRKGRSFGRATFTPEEVAHLFMELYLKGEVQGLFLSSALGEDGIKTQSRIIKTAEILREKYRFKGYLHLKILPCSTFSQVKEVVRLASRASINLEAPTEEKLKNIAPHKSFEEIIKRLRWIHFLTSQAKNTVRAGSTTQFVVGPGTETDRELLGLSSKLYNKFGLRRIYFSAFQPVEKTPLERGSPTPLMREHRLYQADFLIRKYHFSFEEIQFDEGDNLSLKFDPKLVWALSHPESFPVEINSARFLELIRVPGIGPRSANKIIRLRRREKFHNLEELKRVGVWTNRAGDFILINGKRGRTPLPRQLELISC